MIETVFWMTVIMLFIFRVAFSLHKREPLTIIEQNRAQRRGNAHTKSEWREWRNRY